jgi:hypothetical protein
MYIKPSKEDIEKYYVIQNLGSKPTGKILGISPGTVRKLVKEYGFIVRPKINPVKYHANHDFFSSWSHEMAYCLGFITADGHVWKGRPFITIGINKKDKDILEHIRDCISPTSKVRHSKEIVQINIHSPQIWSDLKKYSVTNDKTFNLKVNFDIPEDFWGDYLRGYFDGDGSIFECQYHNKIKKCFRSSFVCASKPFLDYIQKRLGFGYVRTTRKKYFELSLSQQNTIKLKDIIYKNKDAFKMQRKYNKFLLINHMPNCWKKEEEKILLSSNDISILQEKLPNRKLTAIKARKKQLEKLQNNYL